MAKLIYDDSWATTSVRAIMARLDQYFDEVASVRSLRFLTWHEPLRNSKRNDFYVLPDGLMHFIDSRKWTANSQNRFWTASSRLRDVLVQYIGLPESSVGLIPRYRLYAAPKPRYSFENSDSFVLAQRQSPAKNLDLALSLLKELKSQKSFRHHPIFVCSSNGDDVANIKKHSSFKGISFLGNLGPKWFDDLPSSRPAFVSLSTLHHEDFGVAAAEAQEARMPILLSRWFGHLDTFGPETYGISTRDVLAAQTLSAKRAGQKLADGIAPYKKLESKGHENPEFVSGNEIIGKIKALSSEKKSELSVYLEPLRGYDERIRICKNLSRLLGVDQ